MRAIRKAAEEAGAEVAGIGHNPLIGKDFTLTVHLFLHLSFGVIFLEA
jgi:hypothetical protein